MVGGSGSRSESTAGGGGGEGGGGGDAPPKGDGNVSPGVGTDGFNSLASMMGAVGFGGGGGATDNNPGASQSENTEPGAEDEDSNAEDEDSNAEDVDSNAENEGSNAEDEDSNGEDEDNDAEDEDSDSYNDDGNNTDNDNDDTQENPNIESDGTFLGGSYEDMKTEGSKGPGVPPRSIMRDHDSRGGSWSSHSDDKNPNEKEDPKKRARIQMDKYLEKSQAEGKGEADDDTKNDAQRREREKVTQYRGQENLQQGSISADRQRGQEKITDGNEGKDNQNKKFLGSSWQELLKRKGGSAVSSAQYLPKGGGSRLSDGKQSMEVFDKAVMGMNKFKTHAEAVSGWNDVALRNYRGQLLKSPGAAGNIAREQYKREHPGTVG